MTSYLGCSYLRMSRPAPFSTNIEKLEMKKACTAACPIKTIYSKANPFIATKDFRNFRNCSKISKLSHNQFLALLPTNANSRFYINQRGLNAKDS